MIFFILKLLQLIFYFIFDCAGSSLLHTGFVFCFVFFSSCGGQGLLFTCSVQASHCDGFLLQSMGSRPMGFSGCGTLSQY